MLSHAPSDTVCQTHINGPRPWPTCAGAPESLGGFQADEGVGAAGLQPPLDLADESRGGLRGGAAGSERQARVAAGPEQPTPVLVSLARARQCAVPNDLIEHIAHCIGRETMINQLADEDTVVDVETMPHAHVYLLCWCAEE